MNRLVIMTVGKTHSGKTTFAKEVELKLKEAIVIDQDNHAEFINEHYKKLRPKEGPNTLKFSLTKMIVDYAIEQSNLHLILSNSNLFKSARLNVLQYLHGKGFKTIIVYFDLPFQVLKERVDQSTRSKAIFRSASSFLEVLERQEMAKHEEPTEIEADHLFVIRNPEEVLEVIQKIKAIAE